MAGIRFRISESTLDPQPQLIPDLIWYQDSFLADFELTRTQGGDLRHDRQLLSAILICLMTDRRAEDYEVEPGEDPKGWWGDSVQLDTDYGEIGSKLWLLRRSPLNAAAAQRARDYAEEALQPLIRQGAVSRFEVETEIDQVPGILKLAVRGFSEAGAVVVDQRFDVLWSQLYGEDRGNAAPLPGVGYIGDDIFNLILIEDPLYSEDMAYMADADGNPIVWSG